MVADNALGPDGDEVRMRNALESVSGWLDQAITEGRAAVHALRVPDQGRDELSEHLEKILKEHCGDSSLSAALTVVGESRDVAPIVRDELSLIAREAVRNVCLHSQATELRLEIRFAENLTLQVNDNGVGIDPEIASSGKDGHFGLQTMKERSRQIHATLDIRNGRNRGTEVSLLVPGAVAYPRDHQTRGSIVRSLLEHFETHDGD
jgi:signal transduction histidine kinase